MSEHQRVPIGVRFKEAGKVYYFDSGEYELELNGKPSGLKLKLDKVTLKRGDTVVAMIERLPVPPAPEMPAPTKVGEAFRKAFERPFPDVGDGGRGFQVGELVEGHVPRLLLRPVAAHAVLGEQRLGVF